MSVAPSVLWRDSAPVGSLERASVFISKCSLRSIEMEKLHSSHDAVCTSAHRGYERLRFRPKWHALCLSLFGLPMLRFDPSAARPLRPLRLNQGHHSARNPTRGYGATPELHRAASNPE